MLTFFGNATESRAEQPAAPVNIPLYYYYDPSNPLLNTEAKLAIDVGIQGGEAKPYIFDTGSPVFNAAYGSWWGGFDPNSVPESTVLSPDGTAMNNAEFCYGITDFCRGWTGNLVQVDSLSFHLQGDPTAYATLTADPGYVINAGATYVDANKVAYSFPFDSDKPPMYGYFWGVFGAGNFAPEVKIKADDGSSSGSGYYAGGVLGQTIVSGTLAQGYMVAANGQKNPLSDENGPQQVNGITVTVGGETTPVTACSPCVTVGLSAEILGQFWAATPSVGGDDGNAGVIPWAETAESFQNPYGGAIGNNASTERGTLFTTTLTSSEGTVTTTAANLLDTGTGTLNLGVKPSEPIGDVSDQYATDPHCLEDVANGCAVNAGVELAISGAVSAAGDPIVGLAPSEMTITQDTNATYDAQLKKVDIQNTIGISFFTQNSVLFDLTNKVIGYTPFFVTDAALATTADGPLIVDGDNVWLGLAGIVSGEGGITIEDGGKVQLSALNSYGGRTQIRDGADLYISGIGSIAASSGVLNDGVFDISRAWSAVSIKDLAGSGETNLGGQNLIITNASGIFSGVISDDGVFPGITGGSLTLAGGVLTLSGLNTYTGPTRVENGALIVNGAIASNVTVDPGATLAGTGKVESIDVAGIISPGGTTAPGHGIGTLRIAGDAVLAGAAYAVDANAAGASDKLVIDDAVTLDNARLLVLAEGGDYAPSTSYLVIDKTSAGAIVGDFSQITSNSIFVSPSLVYDGGNGNDAVVTLDAVPYETFAETHNQRAVANALDAGTFGPLAASIFYLDEASVREAFTQLAGEVHPTTLGILAEDSRYLRQAVLGRTVQAQYQDLGSEIAISPAGGVGGPEGPAASQVGFWTQAFGSWASYDGNDNTAGGKRDLGGFVSGLDVGLDGGWRLGAAAGYGHSSIALDAGAGSADVDSFSLAAYGGGSLGPVALRAGAAWSWHDIDTARSVVYPGVFEREKASYDGDTGQIFGELAYPILLGDSAVEPFAGLAYVHVKTDGFHEDGGIAALIGENADEDVGFSTLGVRWAGRLAIGETALMPRASLAWQHGFDELTPETAFAFVNEPAIGFTATGLPIVRDSALIDVGLAIELSPGMTLGASYAGQFANDLQDNAVQGRLTWAF
ncbi:MAG: autotransporter domain-containing protein [Hyphomicrobiales bacterium]